MIIFLDEWQTYLETIAEIISNPLHSEDDLNKFEKDGLYKKLYSSFIDSFLSDNKRHIRNALPEFHEHSLLDDEDNILVIEAIWGEAFALYAYYIESLLSFTDSLLEYVDKYIDASENTPGIKTFGVLRFINGRAIQVANEILVLLKNGYPDGAYARFRTIYELGIIGSFIKTHGDDVAEAYAKYSGKKYEWASSIIPYSEVKPKNINLTHIKKYCGIDKANLDKWENEYAITNKLVHASSQGTFSRLSLMSQMNEIPVGPTDLRLDLPAVNTLQALYQINFDYFNCLDDPIINLWLLTLQEIKHMCFDKFEEAKLKHFETDNRDLTEKNKET